MECPYCYRQTRDMVAHLKKNTECSKAHGSKLLGDFRRVVSKQRKQDEEGKDVGNNPGRFTPDSQNGAAKGRIDKQEGKNG